MITTLIHTYSYYYDNINTHCIISYYHILHFIYPYTIIKMQYAIYYNTSIISYLLTLYYLYITIANYTIIYNIYYTYHSLSNIKTYPNDSTLYHILINLPHFIYIYLTFKTTTAITMHFFLLNITPYNTLYYDTDLTITNSS